MKVLIAGDFCERYRVADLISESKYEQLFTEKIRNIIKGADYSIVNFEFPIVIGDKKPIEKCGPNLKGTPKSVEAIQYVGFKCTTLANNHILDYGPEALMDTKQLLRGKGIDTVGAGKNLVDAKQVLYKTIEGNVLAIINCCEHEFSIATDSTPGANPLNPVQLFYSIQEAKKIADHVLVIVHGGHEHWQLPSPRMVETYRYFIDCGADAVVNHHQHCFGGYEVYNGKPIFYGLGNFCFDDPQKQSGLWTEGYAVTIDFIVGNIRFSLHPYSQCAETPTIKLLPDEVYDKRISELNSIINDVQALNMSLNDYYRSTSDQYENAFEPIYNRFYLGAKRRGWVKSLISKQKKLLLENFICCESHRDKIFWWLSSSSK